MGTGAGPNVGHSVLFLEIRGADSRFGDMRTFRACERPGPGPKETPANRRPQTLTLKPNIASWVHRSCCFFFVLVLDCERSMGLGPRLSA